MSEKEIKCCPFCGEEILAVAKKCKHCGKWLDGQNNIDENSVQTSFTNNMSSIWAKKDIASLIIIGGLSLLIGISISCSAQSAIHEIEGTLYFLITAISYLGICILNKLYKDKDEDKRN